MLLSVLFGGLMLIILLALGIADPPRAGSPSWQAESINDWQNWQQAGDLELFSAPVAIASLPFTLELAADNSGTSDSAWGIALQNGDYIWKILVNREGYLSVSTDDRPHWSEFLHIRRDGDNKLYLDVREDDTATLRINDEIAWTGIMPFSENITWGVIHYRSPKIRLC